MRLSAPIETGRLLLRSFEPSDAETLVALDRDPDVKRFTGGTNTREVSLERFAKMLAREQEPTRLITAVVDRATGAIIGWCGLRPFEDTEEIELFYGFARSAWGRGIATEAGAALLDDQLAVEQRRVERRLGVMPRREPHWRQPAHVEVAVDARLVRDYIVKP